MIEMGEAHIGAMLVLAAVESQLASLACNDEPVEDAKAELTADTSGFAWITIVKRSTRRSSVTTTQKLYNRVATPCPFAGRHY